MSKKARAFSRENKLAAIRRMLAGENVSAMARNLPIGTLKGMLPRPKRAVSVVEMNQAISEAAAPRTGRK